MYLYTQTYIYVHVYIFIHMYNLKFFCLLVCMFTFHALMTKLTFTKISKIISYIQGNIYTASFVDVLKFHKKHIVLLGLTAFG